MTSPIHTTVVRRYIYTAEEEGQDREVWRRVRNKKSKLTFQGGQTFLSQATGSILTLLPSFLLYDGKGPRVRVAERPGAGREMPKETVEEKVAVAKGSSRRQCCEKKGSIQCPSD
ncbi:hypothetical protein K0M31_001275 [Melipona bicolor]|uniref:Uncharacterized protein n=1 Tax=Melipona bicolor TaxID=60889 RepID=A0AA40GF65_9HYME|nr:hypothetical protein K0M31_001275 [Melipona bicolor]